jgi:hypothetical protein
MSPVRFNPWRAAEAEVQGVKRKGDSCYNKGSYGKAIKHYTRGAELDPSDISFLIKRAKALSGLGQVRLLFLSGLIEQDKGKGRGVV